MYNSLLSLSSRMIPMCHYVTMQVVHDPKCTGQRSRQHVLHDAWAKRRARGHGRVHGCQCGALQQSNGAAPHHRHHVLFTARHSTQRTHRRARCKHHGAAVPLCRGDVDVIRSWLPQGVGTGVSLHLSFCVLRPRKPKQSHFFKFLSVGLLRYDQNVYSDRVGSLWRFRPCVMRSTAALTRSPAVNPGGRNGRAS